MSFHFDWYQATVLAPQPAIAGMIAAQQASLGLVGVDAKTGLQGYESRHEYVGADGSRHLALMFGGCNPGTNVTGSGCLAEPISGLLRSNFPTHRVSRADVAMDASEDGLFAEVKSKALALAAVSNIETSLYTDPNNPQEGETLYLGGRTSPLRWRIYQKGFEQLAKGRCKPDELDPHWVRVEAQIKPRTKDKPRFSTLSAEEMLGYALWSRRLADELFKMDLAPVRRIADERQGFFRSAQHGTESYGMNFMRVGYMNALLDGHVDPTNEMIISYAAQQIGDWLYNRFGSGGGFDPGFEVFEAVASIERGKANENA